jgi:hypothetical protein
MVFKKIFTVVYPCGILAGTILGATDEIHYLHKHKKEIKIIDYGIYSFMGGLMGCTSGLIWPLVVCAVIVEKISYK